MDISTDSITEIYDVVIDDKFVTHSSSCMVSTIRDEIKFIKGNKENIFDHIFYEIDMLIYCKKEIAKLNEKIEGDSDISTRYYFNILHTSSMTYLRNLIYFFFDKMKKDDIVYYEILKDYGSITNVIDKLKFLCETEISKNICHLTTKRIEKDEYINLNKFFKDNYYFILEKCKQFLELLTTDNVNECYVNDLIEYNDAKNELYTKILLEIKE